MKQIIVGNWKMNCSKQEAEKLILEILNFKNKVEVVVCPPFTSLETVGEKLKNSNVKLGAQNVSEFDKGAYTGEISIEMLKSYNCSYCIVGHSERRQYFGETNQKVNIKSKKLIANGITPIICVGETLAERESGRMSEVILNQVDESLKNISSEEILKTVIAYEPVWAIGTGKTATPEQANDVHSLIRKKLADNFSSVISEKIPILYGGSVKGDNATELLNQKDINGALVGGASLKPLDFIEIINAAKIA